MTNLRVALYAVLTLAALLFGIGFSSAAEVSSKIDCSAKVDAGLKRVRSEVTDQVKSEKLKHDLYDVWNFCQKDMFAEASKKLTLVEQDLLRLKP